MVPEPKFLQDMGTASIVAGIIMLALAQVERWRRAL